jgi:transposase
MRFVPVKSIEQQGRLMVHRARQGFVEQRTATLNRIRGLLSEVGIVLPLKADTVRTQAAALLEDLPGWVNTVIGDLLSGVHRLDERLREHDRHITMMARQDARARQLMQLTGVGETTATALIAMIGNAHDYHEVGRRLPAQPAGPGRTLAAARRQGQVRQHQPLGSGAGRAARLLARRRGHRREERAHGLGRAAPRRELRHAGLNESRAVHAADQPGDTAPHSTHRRVTTSIDASRLDLYGECLFSSWRRQRPRLTNEAPVRVLRQGLQRLSCLDDRL